MTFLQVDTHLSWGPNKIWQVSFGQNATSHALHGMHLKIISVTTLWHPFPRFIKCSVRRSWVETRVRRPGNPTLIWVCDVTTPCWTVWACLVLLKHQNLCFYRVGHTRWWSVNQVDSMRNTQLLRSVSALTAAVTTYFLFTHRFGLFCLLHKQW